ncbi:macrophage mannose receptor 1-like [Neocloeon triangulifer]|uniref:macrophage mannose receptor 1-like n=1 Tax=Neocloeon triangulifer TaxID=2078957 RepID=UPI00286F6372|nr:macrophage mannose receptor 1-like [Neocloeon triangulifer]
MNTLIMHWITLLSATTLGIILIDANAVLNPSIVRINFITAKRPQNRVLISKCCSSGFQSCQEKTTTANVSLSFKTTNIVLQKTTVREMTSIQSKEITTEEQQIASDQPNEETAVPMTTDPPTTNTPTIITPTTTTMPSTVLSVIESSTSSSTSTVITSTLTTTTLPPCLPFQCTPDASKLDVATGKVDPKAVTSGVLRSACDRLYLFSSDLKKWTDAASFCCSLGMQLITIESWQRITCISDLMNSPEGSGISGEYLTSLSDYQKESEFLWCTGNLTQLGNLTWKSGEPSDKGLAGEEEDCTSIQVSAGSINNNVLHDVSCDSSLKYICETPYTTTTKPPCLPYTCEKNSSLLDKEEYINPNAPINGELRLACGRMYFFSNTEQTWPDAAAECCKRNMQLLSIENAQETLCLSSMIARPNYGGFASRWWTAGSDEYHEKYFVWCTASSTKNITSEFKFGEGQPDNAGGNENCIEWVVEPNNVYFNDRACLDVKNRYICETYERSMPKCPNGICQTEAAKVELSTKWKTSDDGTFRRACGKQYFLSKIVKSKAEAETECCKYGLKLLSIDSYKEIECIADMNKAEFGDYKNSYWTSASNDGFGCEFTYGFCGSNKLLYQNFSNFWPNEPSHPLFERCLEMKLDGNPESIRFGDLSCTEGRYFICEGDVADCTPTCPDKTNCTKDKTLFNSKGGLLDTHIYGRYGSGCGKSFLFSANKLSWSRALEMCCKLGMELVSIEDDAKMKCIYETNANDTLLKQTSEFWTSGTQQDCNYRFKFCSSGASILRNDSKWAPNDPNNYNENEWCVASRFAPTETLAKDQNNLFDQDCNVEYRYICEMPAKPCTAVSCYDYNCVPDPAKVSQFTAMSGPDGQFQTFCGRKYFLHTESKNYKEAYDECCKYGMELVSVETNFEKECIIKGFQSAGWGSVTFWTSGTSNGVGCVPGFGWCPKGTLLSADSVWFSNEPSAPYHENCIVLNFDANDLSQSKFNDAACLNGARFLCEERS